MNLTTVFVDCGGGLVFLSKGCKTCLLRGKASCLALLLMSTLSGSMPARAKTVPSSAFHVQIQEQGVRQQIEILLERARAARNAGRLVQPPGDNAAEYYAEVLKLDPGNREARNAIIALHPAIRRSLAESHGRSAELLQLDALAGKLAMPQGVLGAEGPLSGSGQPRPPVEHYSPAAGRVAQPPPGHAAPPPAEPVPPSQGQTPLPAGHPGGPPPQPSAAPPATSDDIDQIVQNLPLGNIVFNTPKTIPMGQTETIQLFLSGSAAVDQLKRQITAPGPLEADRIQISDQLAVHLRGENFQIQANTPESQAVGHSHTAHWEWQVTPTRRGAQQLKLSVFAIIRIDGVDREAWIKTYDRTIDVNVDWPDWLSAFIGANWQWLWTAIFVPIILIVRRRLRGGKAIKNA